MNEVRGGSAPPAGDASNPGAGQSSNDRGKGAAAQPSPDSTFRAINLKLLSYGTLELPGYVKQLLEELGEVREQRYSFYNGLRASNAQWVMWSRRFLAVMGAVAFLLTGAAAALQLNQAYAELSRWGLLAVLVIYAAMGALLYYDRATDKAGSYFRYVTTILTMRDLWTKLQFEILKQLESIRGSSDAKQIETVRQQVLALTEAYCNDLDKITTSEATEWRTAFQASLSQLEETARKGTADVTNRIQEYAKAAAQAAAESKAAAEAVAAASQPGLVNLTIKGEFDGEVSILVDGAEATRSPGKAIALDGVQVGARKIGVHAEKGGKQIEASRIVDVKPGIQALELSF